MIPLFYIRAGQYQLLRYIHNFENSQWWSEERIKNNQWERLKTLINHVYETVPYYKKLMNRNDITPDDIKDFDDFSKFPILTKKMVRDNLKDMLSTKYKTEMLIHDSTGGSTGSPLLFYYDNDFLLKKLAATYRHFSFSGYKPGDRISLIWGMEKDISSHLKKKMVMRYLFKTLVINAFNLSESKLNSFCSEIEKFKPLYLRGYANCLYLLAKYVMNRGLQYKFKAVISEAEKLDISKRVTIEKAFQTKVFNLYGCREFGTIASECDKGEGMHINAENIYVETEWIESHYGSERIIVTSLHNFAMPFLRYDMQDVGSSTNIKCTCGRNLPLLKEVSGRTSNFFLTADCKYIHGEYFTHLLYGSQGIENFQLIQETINKFDLKIVRNSKFNKKSIKPLLEGISNVFGANSKVEISLVKSIPNEVSGKYLFTKSKVSVL